MVASPSAFAAANAITGFIIRLSTFGALRALRAQDGGKSFAILCSALAAGTQVNPQHNCEAHDQRNGQANEHLPCAPLALRRPLDLLFKCRPKKNDSHDSDRLHRLFLGLVRTIDVQPLHAVTQGVARELQLFGRAAHAETILLQRVLD